MSARLDETGMTSDEFRKLCELAKTRDRKLVPSLRPSAP